VAVENNECLDSSRS